MLYFVNWCVFYMLIPAGPKVPIAQHLTVPQIDPAWARMPELSGVTTTRIPEQPSLADSFAPLQSSQAFFEKKTCQHLYSEPYFSCNKTVASQFSKKL